MLYLSSARVISDACIYGYAEYKGDEYLMDAVAAKVDGHVQDLKNASIDTAADGIAMALPFVPAGGTRVLRSVRAAKIERESMMAEKKLEKSIQVAKQIKQNNKGIRSYEIQIQDHLDKIKNPRQYLDDPKKIKEFDSNPRYREGLIKHWQAEIETFQKNIEKLKDENTKLGK